jgi:hypothetical protein
VAVLEQGQGLRQDPRLGGIFQPQKADHVEGIVPVGDEQGSFENAEGSQHHRLMEIMISRC